MPASFLEFCQQALARPALLVTVLLLCAVILVNGWTDAPNAIATAVTTGAVPFRAAAAGAAVCNLLGVVCAAAANTSVAQTIYAIADFGGGTERALAALCAAMTAIVLWAAGAWRFGIPTSESHALAAGIAGAALALPGGVSNLRPGPWGRVLLGLVLSVVLGFLGGALAARALPGGGRSGLYSGGQVLGAGASAFLHGAQDGQKFLGVFLLGASLSQGRPDSETFLLPAWLPLLCALLMGLGTLLGGRRIVENVGRNLVPLTPRLGFAADLGSAASLLLCTLLGLPASTTHTKTAAILGAGGGRRANRRAAGSIALAWVCTFPGCGLIAFVTARGFLALL